MADFSRKLKLMGGDAEFILYDVDGRSAGKYFDAIHAEGLRLQRVFDFFDPDSELSALNRSRVLDVSDEMLEVLEAALGYCSETDGRYDVTLGRQTAARKQHRPLPAVSCAFRDVGVDGNTVTLGHPDALLDLGSIAKGYIVDRLVGFMGGIGLESGFVDARGDMRIFGRHLEVVGVQHPREAGVSLNPIVLENLAVATSGDYMQYDGSFERSHIVGAGDFASVSAAAGTLAEADAVATCVFVLGVDGAGEFLGRRPGVRVFGIDRGLGEHCYNGFESLSLRRVASGL